MNKLIIPFILILNFICFAGANEKSQELKTVDYVDLNRITGTWYEIARISNFLEKNLVAVTATYTLFPNGDMELLNSGRKLALDGEIRIKKGKAWVIDKKTNAKLRASFI